MNFPRGADELAALRALWQRGAPAGIADLEVSECRAILRRRRTIVRVMMALDVLATVGVLVLAAWVAVTLPGLKWIAWSVFVSLLATAAMVSALLVRRRVWALDVDVGAEEMVEVSIRQLRASLGMLRIVYAVVAAAFAFLLLWGWYDFATLASPTPQILRERWLGYGLSAAYGLAFFLWALVTARRRRRQLGRWEALARTLREDDADAGPPPGRRAG